MFCKSCGERLDPETKFCRKCGTPAGEDAAKGYSGDHHTGVYHDGPSVYDDPRTVISTEKKGLGAASIFNIVLGVVIVLLIALIVVVVVKSSVEKDPDDVVTSDEKVEVMLNVDSVPATVASYNYTLSGNVTVKGCDAELCINGTVIETIKADSENKKWQYAVNLDSKYNNFEITLCDPSNRSETLNTKAVSIQNTAYKENVAPQTQTTIKPSSYAKGTYLYKTCAEGLNIRKSYSKSAKIVEHLESYEYSTPMICQGYEYFDGTYTWYQVAVRGTLGWVRGNNVDSGW